MQKSIQMSVKIYPPIHKALVRLAKKLKVSINWLINSALAGLLGVNPAEIEPYRRNKND